MELASNYAGDLEEAFNLFEENWSAAVRAGTEDRTFREALGVDLLDYEKFELDEIPIKKLLIKYGRKAAAYI